MRIQHESAVAHPLDHWVFLEIDAPDWAHDQLRMHARFMQSTYQYMDEEVGTMVGYQVPSEQDAVNAMARVYEREQEEYQVEDELLLLGPVPDIDIHPMGVTNENEC